MGEKRSLFEEFIQDPENRRLFLREHLTAYITEELCRALDELGVADSDRARRVGMSERRFTRILGGEVDLRLSAVSDLFAALGYEIEVRAKPFSGEE